MKTKIKLTIYVTIITCCFITQLANAQWWNFYVAVSGNNFDQADETNAIESVGIGDFNGNAASPASAFHINTNFFGYLPNTTSYTLGEVFRTDCPGNANTYWRMLRGNTEYGWLYNNPQYPAAIYADDKPQDFHMHAPENEGSLVFHTGFAPNPNYIHERMRIYDAQYTTSGNANPGMVRIGYGTQANGYPNGFPTVNPISEAPKLIVVGQQIQGSSFTGSTVAEFRDDQSNGSSVGIKIRGSRGFRNFENAAHIDLSNYDYDETATGVEFIMSRLSSDMQDPTRLDGIFQIYTNPGTTSTTPVLPTSKFFITRDGLTGVGTIFNNGNNVTMVPEQHPYTRLEVEDPNGVQLRLTNTYAVGANQSINNGIWTDMQTTALGDLFIHPSYQDAVLQPTAIFRNVGINTSTPDNTLEIDAYAGAANDHDYTGVSGGRSGLRFNDLNSTSPVITSNGKVLTVNITGDVVLTDDDKSSGIALPSGASLKDKPFV